MFFIVGLGNPGPKYQNNRHNVGFMFIDFLITENSNLKSQNQISKLQTKKNLSSIIYHLTSNIILVKPQTFMNHSSLAVKKILSNFQTFKLSNLIVVHDDLDIPLGKFKIQKGVGPKLHNGIESIEKALGTKDFWRVRIGIDNRRPERWLEGETYVLQDFLPEEKRIIKNIFPKIWQRLTHLFNNFSISSTP